jgi:Membrane-bound toxin component of toxin-antitoxin system
MNHRDNAFNLPIRIYYRPPKALMYFMSTAHTGALLCLFPVVLPLWLKALLMILVAANHIRFFRCFSKQQTAESRPQLFLSRDDVWSLIDADNNAVPLTLQPGALVHRLLLVLRFIAEDGKSYAFILRPENVEQNTLRRLRVRLLHGKRLS